MRAAYRSRTGSRRWICQQTGHRLRVIDRLGNSADKVGGYSYTTTICGGINLYMGCGRLDAQGAIQ